MRAWLLLGVGRAVLPLSPDNMLGGMQKVMMGDSIFKFRMHAPQEDADDTIGQMDGLKRIIDSEMLANADDYADQKQRILEDFQAGLDNVIRAGCDILLGSVPNAITSTVIEAVQDALP